MKLLLLLLLPSLFSTSITSSPTPKLEIFKDYVQINDSLYASKYETTQKEYIEYLSSIRMDSTLDFYHSQLPDAKSLNYIINVANFYYGQPYMDNYFTHPAYGNLPVIGISLEQAKRFCNWKSNKYNKKYANQNFSYSLQFRLPSPTEWESTTTNHALSIKATPLKELNGQHWILKGLDSLSSHKRPKTIYKIQVNTSQNWFITHNQRLHRFSTFHRPLYGKGSQPMIVGSFAQNEKSIANLIGNVSELTSDWGIAKGLNYTLPYSQDYEKMNISYSTPEPWLGFRVFIEVESAQHLNTLQNPPNDFPIPKGYTVLDEAIGDLDKDGIAEKVVVFDTNHQEKSHKGTKREIHIFKKTNQKWILWHQSSRAILSSKQGRMDGDSFEGIRIERGCIVIFHFMGLGGYQKSSYTHRFRYQNNTWELIGATTISGSPCRFWEKFDFNLSTGKIVYEKETEDCTYDIHHTDSKTFMKKIEASASNGRFFFYNP